MKASIEEKDSHVKHGTYHFTYLNVMQIKCKLNIEKWIKNIHKPNMWRADGNRKKKKNWVKGNGNLFDSKPLQES